MNGLLVNNGEIRLRKLLQRYGQYDICPKVRVLDVFGVPHPAWSKDETWFAFRSHFDFVLVDKDEPMTVEAAIELDGRVHEFSEEQARRDRTKNSLCRKANFPLFRFGYHHLQELLGESWVEYLLYVWAVDQYVGENDVMVFPRPPQFLIAPVLKAREMGDPIVHASNRIEELGEDEFRGRWVRESVELRLASGRSAAATCLLSESTVPLRSYLLLDLAGEIAEYDCLRKLGFAA